MNKKLQLAKLFALKYKELLLMAVIFVGITIYLLAAYAKSLDYVKVTANQKISVTPTSTEAVATATATLTPSINTKKRITPTISFTITKTPVVKLSVSPTPRLR